MTVGATALLTVIVLKGILYASTPHYAKSNTLELYLDDEYGPRAHCVWCLVSMRRHMRPVEDTNEASTKDDH